MEVGSVMASGPLRSEARSLRPPCRNFARGFCRWGQSCRFSHDRESAPVCRYFQRGFCRYGEHCSYQHIQEQPAPLGTHYSLMPHWHCGLEPGTEPTATDQDQKRAQCTMACSMTCVAFKFPKVEVEVEEKDKKNHGPGPEESPVHHGPGPEAMDQDQKRAQCTMACSMTCVAFKFPKVEVEVEEKDKKNIPAVDNVLHGAISKEFVPTKAWGASGLQPQWPALKPGSSDPKVLERVTQTDPVEVPAEPAAEAAVVTPAMLRARSEAAVCGICMDRVYEKALPEERLFGILPNCSHAYCLGCIRRWRRSRAFLSTVIKACPECRIPSNYYIPHKYFISDVADKEMLIRAFTARTGKIRCKFFLRGHCPFGSECIYLHELPAGGLRRHRQRQRRMPAVFIPSSSESSDEEDEELCTLEWALTLAMLETKFPGSIFGQEMLLIDCSDSD